MWPQKSALHKFQNIQSEVKMIFNVQVGENKSVCF